MADGIKPGGHRGDSRLHLPGALMTLVTVNIVIFIGLRLCLMADPAAAERIIIWPALSSAFVAERPWTLLTYMFTQYDALHILLNMIWLVWFWMLGAANGLTNRSLILTFFIGGLTAGAAYVAIIPDGIIVGSSGAVLAVLTAVAVAVPRARTDLPLLRSIRPWMAAVVIVILELVCHATGSISAHIAHPAGILVGIAAGLTIRRSRPRNKPSEAKTCADSTDFILAKLRSSGYQALNPDERKALTEEY